MNKLSIIILGLLATLAFGQEAIAVFYDVNNGGITGTASFVFNGTAVAVTISLSGIDRDVPHGIHIHQYGDLRGLTPFNDGNSTVVGPASVGDHYNPDNYTHGCPTGNNTSHHNGDLGNWNVTGGTINETKIFNYLNVTGLRSIVGRAIVLHNTTDDCNVTTSAGARRAIGIIGIAGNNTANTVSGPISETSAVAVLMGTGNCQGSNCMLNNSGIVVFNSTNGGSLQISAQVWGLSEVRGFHIHWFGDLRDAQAAALMVGGHYNPDDVEHGLPVVDATLHRGDLGNIQNFADGNAYYNYNPNNQLTISAILGRAVVIHSMLDHGGAASDCPNASMNGDAGSRVWVAVIGVPNPSIHLSGPNVSAVDSYNNTFEVTPCSNSPTPAPQPAPEGAPEPQGPTPTPTPIAPTTPSVTPTVSPTAPTPALPVTPIVAPTFTPTPTPTNAGGKFLFSGLLFALVIAFAICQ